MYFWQVYLNKLKELKKLVKDLVYRVKELKERPKALEALNSMLNHSEFFLVSVRNLSLGEDPMFTEVEATTLEKLINETYVSRWRNSSMRPIQFGQCHFPIHVATFFLLQNHQILVFFK